MNNIFQHAYKKAISDLKIIGPPESRRVRIKLKSNISESEGWDDYYQPMHKRCYSDESKSGSIICVQFFKKKAKHPSKMIFFPIISP